MFDEMFKNALKAQEKSYSPYSKFAVGACILTETGNLYSGCNVENAVFHGCCAELNAITTMIAGGDKKIKEILIVGGGDGLVTPCGICRQNIREFASKETLIHICGLQGLKKTFTLEELLPYSFGPENLK